MGWTLKGTESRRNRPTRTHVIPSFTANEQETTEGFNELTAAFYLFNFLTKKSCLSGKSHHHHRSLFWVSQSPGKIFSQYSLTWGCLNPAAVKWGQQCVSQWSQTHHCDIFTFNLNTSRPPSTWPLCTHTVYCWRVSVLHRVITMLKDILSIKYSLKMLLNRLLYTIGGNRNILLLTLVLLSPPRCHPNPALIFFWIP